MATKLPAIASLSAADVLVATEPAWLQTWRQQSLAAFAAHEMPYWRRTDLTAFAFADMQLSADVGTF